MTVFHRRPKAVCGNDGGTISRHDKRIIDEFKAALEERGRKRGELPRRGPDRLALEAMTPKPGEHDPTLRPPEDGLYAMSLLQGICGGELDSVCVTTVYGNPHSKARPMVVGNHAMKPKQEIMAEEALAKELDGHVRYDGNAAMVCIFFRPNKQRIDADNMLKHVCDAANGVLWDDDSQCTAVLGVVELDVGLPRTVIATAKHITSMRRGSDDVLACLHCGGHFRRSNTKKYCSRECVANARDFILLDRPVPCEFCQQMFVRKTTAQRMCSPECRVDSLRGKRKSYATPLSCCSTCGKQLAHKRGGRCRDCWRADPHPD